MADQPNGKKGIIWAGIFIIIISIFLTWLFTSRLYTSQVAQRNLNARIEVLNQKNILLKEENEKLADISDRLARALIKTGLSREEVKIIAEISSTKPQPAPQPPPSPNGGHNGRPKPSPKPSPSPSPRPPPNEDCKIGDIGECIPELPIPLF